MTVPAVSLRGSGAAWSVCVAGRPHGPVYTHPDTAAAAANRLEAALAATIRPCIRCRAPMRSTHRGHRMCDACRNWAGTAA
jgi:hypothetical protein